MPFVVTALSSKRLCGRPNESSGTSLRSAFRGSEYQPSATSTLFLDNLPHWGEHFDKHFNLDLWLTLLSKCSPQWGRLTMNPQYHSARDSGSQVLPHRSHDVSVDSVSKCQTCFKHVPTTSSKVAHLDTMSHKRMMSNGVFHLHRV